jgi:hypothetical protein
MPYEPPIHRRSCLGLVLAPTLATFLFAIGMALLEPGSGAERLEAAALFLLLGLFLGAFPATVLLGFPIYLVLRGRFRATPILCGTVGAAVGLATALTWQLAIIPGAIPLASSAGFVGGLVFWWIAATEANRDLR